MPKEIIINPDVSRILGALSSFSYTTQSSICDLIDNSISHGKAKNIYIYFDYDDKIEDFRFIMLDDGVGMDCDKLEDAMKLGSSNSNYDNESGLEMYGVGLKTASIAHCTKLLVCSKSKSSNHNVVILDSDKIKKENQWVYTQEIESNAIQCMKYEVTELLKLYSIDVNQLDAYTLLSWRNMNHLNAGYSKFILSHKKQNFKELEISKVTNHIKMVFHRFLDHEVIGKKINIHFNGKKLVGWDPFRSHLKNCVQFDFEGDKQYISKYQIDSNTDPVLLKGYILPKKEDVSVPEERDLLLLPQEDQFDRSKKIDKWQGVYVYRNDRLIDYGSWLYGIAIEPHTTYARCSIDLKSCHDELFSIDVSKTRIKSYDKKFKDWLKESSRLPSFRTEAKKLYGSGVKKRIKNKIRDNQDKINAIINYQATKDNIRITDQEIARNETRSKVQNKAGTYEENVINAYLDSRQLLQPIEMSDDSKLWKVSPSGKDVMLIEINVNHPLYQKYYLSENSDSKKITTIIDAFIIALSYSEICNKTQATKYLHEDIKMSIESVLEKLQGHKVI